MEVALKQINFELLILLIALRSPNIESYQKAFFGLGAIVDLQIEHAQIRNTIRVVHRFLIFLVDAERRAICMNGSIPLFDLKEASPKTTVNIRDIYCHH